MFATDFKNYSDSLTYSMSVTSSRGICILLVSSWKIFLTWDSGHLRNANLTTNLIKAWLIRMCNSLVTFFLHVCSGPKQLSLQKTKQTNSGIRSLYGSDSKGAGIPVSYCIIPMTFALKWLL